MTPATPVPARSPAPAAGRTPLLICLPPAGAGPSLFFPWTRRHPGRVEILPVSLPGREARIGEPLAESLEALADGLAADLALRLAVHPAQPYALFGYSMGAVLGYEIGRRLARMGLPKPEMLFLLGCNPPDSLAAGHDPLHLMDSAAFWETLVDLGGTPRELLADPEALQLFEPSVRNDFRLCETYRPDMDAPPLGWPAHAFFADGDRFADAALAPGWTRFLGGPLTQHTLSGNHMLGRAEFAALLDRLLALWPDRGIARNERTGTGG
ncbi:thioesterase II family protein [Methylobrevis pamukkalensis]|uniref:Linear gramicidin dehydrogenase LgrE n=1 Tax=Methylobrevis pamukkalensis TaxID=1439726 RepID=A0A1E3H766_9HYPH|nr:thioesterase domain-containing protein [Methylobrevis pamukkalensis]ODN72162.1 Linear gramicidin dehydrogenase LgrE [Methylobrevis pamukkalensis]